MIPEKSMLLISAYKDQAPTFKMIPLNQECPFGEAIYVPSAKVLLILYKHTVEGLHMVPKLNDDGEPVLRKTPAKDGNPYRQERRVMNLPQDSYIHDKEEIKAFIQMFAINPSFDYEKLMIDPKIILPETPKIILPS